MTTATDGAVPAVTESEPEAPAASLGLVRLVGYGVLAIELICFLSWSALLYHRFALTYDFALYHQGWYLIAHGNLDPINTLQRHPYVRDHGEFIMWPLALLYWIPPHDLMLLWVQDVGVVLAQALAFTWICQLAQKCRPGRKDAAVLAGVGLVLLVGNPWWSESISWDFHTESLSIVFLVLLAWDLAEGRRREWLWVVPLLACGDVAYTYLATIGIGAMLAARRTRLTGLAMAGIGAIALEAVRLVGGDLSSPFWMYSYLDYPGKEPFSLGALAKGMLYNPREVIHQLWFNRQETWSNLGASGLLGLGSVLTLPLIIAVLLTNDLAQGNLFSPPEFQSLPLYTLLPVGTVGVLGWIARRRRLLAAGAAALVLAQTLYYAATYGPELENRWLDVPARTAATLSRVQARIPASAEVISSQGVVGRFSGRTDIEVLWGGRDPIPLDGAQVWFVIVPYQGIETNSPQEAMELIQKLNGPLHATLITRTANVWVYRWQPPRGQHEITVWTS